MLTKKIHNYYIILAVASGVCFIHSSNAQASTAPTSFQVSANVLGDCTVTATDLDFGDYTPDPSTSSITSNITVQCTDQTAYNIGLDGGVAGDVTARNMTMDGTDDVLEYALYQDSGYMTNWGETVGMDTYPDTGTGSLQGHLVYGQLSSGQFVEAGMYTDTINVTVTY